MTLIFTVALAAAFIVVVLVLVAIIIYQRWRIGDHEEQRQKMRKAGIL